MLELARKLKEIFPDEPLSSGMAGAISAATGIRPVEALLKYTRKNPDQVIKLLEFCDQASFRFLEAFVKEFGPVSTSIADPVVCNDILSIKQFENIELQFLESETKKLE